jgi:hypothetical protein
MAFGRIAGLPTKRVGLSEISRVVGSAITPRFRFLVWDGLGDGFVHAAMQELDAVRVIAPIVRLTTRPVVKAAVKME